jgi:hypothetical protein
MTTNVHLLSFASSRFGSLYRLEREARAMGCFSSVTLLTAKDLDEDYWRVCSDFVRTHPHRGFGFWTWKPYIILKELEKLSQGDVLLYLDAGCSLNVDGINRLRAYINQVVKHPSGWFVFKTNYSMSQYTKRILLEKYGFNNQIHRDLPMFQCSCHFIVVQASTIKLAKQWFESMQERALIDDSFSQNENIDFIAHRHDQSVFSILAHQYGVESIEDETYWSPKWNVYLDYPIHTRRWKHRIGWPTSWMRLPWIGSLLQRF